MTSSVGKATARNIEGLALIGVAGERGGDECASEIAGSEKDINAQERKGEVEPHLNLLPNVTN